MLCGVLPQYYERQFTLNVRARKLMQFGEDWQDDMCAAQYYEDQKTWALLRFCWKEKSCKFELAKMMESDLLND